MSSLVSRDWLFYVLVLYSLLVGGCSCGEGVVRNEPGSLSTDLKNNLLTFTNVPVGKKKQKTFRLYTRNTGAIEVHSLEIRSELKGAFRIVKAPRLPFTIDPSLNNGVFLTIEYHSTVEKTVQARLLVGSKQADNVDANGYFRVGLRHLLERSSPVWSCGGSLRFSNVPRGERKTLECSLKNVTGEPLDITGVKFEAVGKVTGFFRLQPLDYPVTLPADNKTELRFSVTYSPSLVSVLERGTFVFQTSQLVTTRSRKLQLEVVANVVSARMELVPLYSSCTKESTCTALDTRLTCKNLPWNKGRFCVPKPGERPFLNFPDVLVGQGISMSIAIRSVGELPLRVESLKLGKNSREFELPPLPGGLPFTLAPGSSRLVSVVYRPVDLKPDKDELLIESNADGQQREKIFLQAGALGCRLKQDVSSLVFYRDKLKSIQLENKGTGICLLSSVRLQVGGKRPFYFSENYNGKVIRPGETLSLSVFYNPSQKDVQEDWLLVRSNDSRQALIRVKLKVGDPLLECLPRLLPSSGLDFGQVKQGERRALPLVVFNEGEGNCTLSTVLFSIRKPAGATSVFRLKSPPVFPFVLGSGKRLTLQVEFLPEQGHSYFEGTMIVRTSSLKRPAVLVELRGREATRACLRVLPSVVRFGTTLRKCSAAPKEVELFLLARDDCPTSVNVINAKLGSHSSLDFVVSSKVMLPVTLRKGESVKVQVAYKPQDLGGDSGTLIFQTSSTQEPSIAIPIRADSDALTQHTDTFVVPARTKVDVLFVVDDSSSMADRQANLARNFQSFIQWASGLKNDFHIGIVSTDTTGSRFSPGCLRGTPRVLTDKTPDLVKVFSRNIKLGTIGSGNEKGLEAAYRALSPKRLSEFRCNLGFLRKDAGLSLIFVSDELDNSPQPVDFYIQYFKSLKPGKEWVRASAIVGPPPGGCRIGKQFAQAAPRYWKVAKTFGGVQTSICRDDWSSALSNIGIITLGARSEWVLSRPAIEASLVVRVDGKSVPKSTTDGWSYAPDLNSVIFSNNRVPPVRSKIQISYKIQCQP